MKEPIGLRLCRCLICTCGKHPCLKRHKHRPDCPLGDTEYMDRYLKYPIDLRKSFKPRQELCSSDIPIEDKTTHRVDYIAHPLHKPFKRDLEEYRKPDQPMDTQTNYNQHFTGKVAPPAKAIRHDCKRKDNGRFEGLPTYVDDYRKWNIKPPKHFGPSYAWAPPDIPFEGESTHQKDYIRYSEPMRESCKPLDRVVQSEGPVGDSDYRQSYVPHRLPPKFVREKETHCAPGIPLDTLTTFRRDYVGKQAPKVVSCKPLYRAMGSDAPLENLTTSRADYRRWPTARPNKHEYDPYKRPEGEIDLSTTYNNAYLPKYGDPAKACKPMPARCPGGQFDGVTNYMTEYKPWYGHRPPKAMLKPELCVSDAPFDGLSTHKAHYIKHPQLPRSKSCRPFDRNIGSGEPLEGSTEYRTEFIPKIKEECPVPTIGFPQSPYMYKNIVDDAGHVLCERKSESLRASPVTKEEFAMEQNLPTIPLSRSMTAA